MEVAVEDGVAAPLERLFDAPEAEAVAARIDRLVHDRHSPANLRMVAQHLLEIGALRLADLAGFGLAARGVGQLAGGCQIDLLPGQIGGPLPGDLRHLGVGIVLGVQDQEQDVLVEEVIVSATVAPLPDLALGEVDHVVIARDVEDAKKQLKNELVDLVAAATEKVTSEVVDAKANNAIIAKSVKEVK